MADIYLSNQPAGTYGGVVWGTPSDANDGESSASPKLTADAAFQLYDNSIYDGGTLFINDGDYEFTALDGRFILSHASSNIQPSTDYGTTVVFSGSSTQGLRYNFGTEARTGTIGKIIIKTSPEKYYGIYSSGSNSSLAQSIINCEARFVPNTDGTADSATRYGYYDATGSGQVNILGGGVSAADGSMVDISNEAYSYRPYFQSSSLLYNPSLPAVVDISAWAFNIKMNMVSGRGVIDIDTANQYPAGSNINVSGVTGTVEVTNIDDSMVWFAFIDNPPTGSTVSNNTINISTSNNTGCSGIMMLGREFDALDLEVSDNDLTIASHSGIGFGILLGAEGTTGQYANTSGDITGNTVTCSNTGVNVNAIHGINHIHAEGSRYNNTVSGVAIGSLTKASGALSYRNTISIDPTSGSKVYLYSKGGYAGARFYKETLVSTAAFTGNFIQSFADDTTGGADFYSDDTFFVGINITGDVDESAAKIFEVGNGVSDTSSATVIDVSFAFNSLTTYGEQAGTSYTTLESVNALSNINNIGISASTDDSSITTPTLGVDGWETSQTPDNTGRNSTLGANGWEVPAL